MLLLFSHYVGSYSFAIWRTVAHQAPLSMGLSRQEYWSGLPCPSPGDLPDPGIKSGSLALRADVLPSEPPGNPNMYTEYQLRLSPLFEYYARPRTPAMTGIGHTQRNWGTQQLQKNTA